MRNTTLLFFALTFPFTLAAGERAAYCNFEVKEDSEKITYGEECVILPSFEEAERMLIKFGEGAVYAEGTTGFSAIERRAEK